MQRTFLAFSSGVSPAGCVGDFDFDAMVGVSDLLLLPKNFACTSTCSGDLDGDGTVTADDFMLFLGMFGTLCADE